MHIESPAAAPRRAFIGIGFDPLDTAAASRWLSDVTVGDPYRYVVTPNVDHLVRLEALGEGEALGQELRAAYDEATLVLCDSRVLARLARIYGVALPLAPGSDLTVRLLHDVARPGDRIAIIGGDADLLAGLRARFPLLDWVQHVPPMGLLRNEQALAAAVTFGREARARFLFIAVGSPQQELLARRIAQAGRATGCALCIGASLDFIVGRQRRAPRMVQRLGLEWAHRLVSQPGRLWRRYLVDGPRIFRMARAWHRGHGKR
ncbi:WecB/TagA/CpsF family glycosyltransferase [Sphingomonas endophytica]|uniref:Glycosyl transferase n=1 Tax=Sphingomonas endophytica TaxID=869719 RepID=A0A147I3C4_9SPHN|nr:WecB/TagA/CpsF family glycosyltransferase [Sphingomonas endophytica]KTT72473.1 glycosyl transferase [Sphingomonas endophytica]